jgi:hypothetical protein
MVFAAGVPNDELAHLAALANVIHQLEVFVSEGTRTPPRTPRIFHARG